MKLKGKQVFAIILLIALNNLLQLVANDDMTKIDVSPGPEDLVVDRNHGRNRLLVSCRNLRKPRKNQGEIGEIQLDPANPGSLSYTPLYSAAGACGPFMPHGIELFETDQGSMLYVINHPQKKIHEVLKFSIGASGNLKLEKSIFRESFNRAIHSKGSPNDLTVTEKGIYVTVPARGLGNKSQILFWEYGTTEWVNLFSPLPGKFPNGITTDREELIVAFSMSHDIWRRSLTGDTSWVRVVSGLSGGDNFGAAEEGQTTLLAGHDKMLRFVFHSIFPFVHSRSSVYQLDLKEDRFRKLSLKSKKPFPIMAASTAVETAEAFWLGQVFGDFVLRIDKSEVIPGHWNPVKNSK